MPAPFQIYVQSHLGGDGRIPWGDVLFSGERPARGVTPIAWALARLRAPTRDGVAHGPRNVAGALALSVVADSAGTDSVAAVYRMNGHPVQFGI